MKSSKSQNLYQITDGIDQLIKFTQRLTHQGKKMGGSSTDSALLLSSNANCYSKSLSDLNKISNKETSPFKEMYVNERVDLDENAQKTVIVDGKIKLVSAYGNYCGFSGGDGSGGCVVTGPYEASYNVRNNKSDSSFDSTEITEDTNDLNEPPDVNCDNFQYFEVVWAKRSGLPWFPGIVVDLFNLDRDTKDYIRSCGANVPPKNDLEDMKEALRKDHDMHCVVLFNKKYSWVKVDKKKMKKFTKNNEHYFMQSIPLLGRKLRKDLEKAYKRAKKHIE